MQMTRGRSGCPLPGPSLPLCTRLFILLTSPRVRVPVGVCAPIRWNICALLMVIQQPFLSSSIHPEDGERGLVELGFPSKVKPFSLSGSRPRRELSLPPLQ